MEEKALNLIEVFKLIEQFMDEGEQNIKNAVATCFLENLQNVGTPPEKWVQYLGEKSRSFCQAWDEFTGVSTPGI